MVNPSSLENTNFEVIPQYILVSPEKLINYRDCEFLKKMVSNFPRDKDVRVTPAAQTYTFATFLNVRTHQVARNILTYIGFTVDVNLHSPQRIVFGYKDRK